MAAVRSSPTRTDTDERILSLPFLVRDIMTVDPVTVPPFAGVKRIAATLIDHDVHSIPVIDEAGRLLGVVS